MAFKVENRERLDNKTGAVVDLDDLCQVRSRTRFYS